MGAYVVSNCMFWILQRVNETAPARCVHRYERCSSLAETNIDMAFQSSNKSTALSPGKVDFQ